MRACVRVVCVCVCVSVCWCFAAGRAPPLGALGALGALAEAGKPGCLALGALPGLLVFLFVLFFSEGGGPGVWPCPRRDASLRFDVSRPLKVDGLRPTGPLYSSWRLKKPWSRLLV